MCVLYYAFSFFVALNFASANFFKVDLQVQEQCVQRCRLQNYTDSGHYEDNFGSEIQCSEGCNLWKDALNSSCQKVCDAMEESLSPKQLYCLMGCNDAVTKYYTELRLHLGTPPPPALVADSLTATSLKLEWNFPVAREAGLKYFLQWRYEENAGAWEYCRNQSWGYQETVFVDNLQPYTKYRFRVALILSNLTDPIVSPPSVIISTQAAGEPAHPPTIIRAVPVDSTHISVSWEPGPFPHGPLLSYVLRISDNQPKGYSALKDLPAENHNYIFANLLPSRNYTVSISMRNGVGEGPQAKVLVSTPIEPPVKDSEKPILILGAQHVVIEQGTDLLDEPVILYNTNDFITGLAIHVSQRLLFVSDSARYVHKMPLNNYSNFTKKTVILSPSQMNFIPLDLSMDWLNENLYILGELTHNPKVWQIARCNLFGRGLTVAVAGLRIKPHHFEVDPYNGYLFWVTEIGLFRLDLADVSNGIKHEVRPELILADKNLGAFTVDHTNFRLLVSNQTNKTVNSVSLDGKDISDMRKNIITSKLQKVVSLATANKKFYWTDGNDVLYEEYHPSSAYFHNSYPVQLSRSYIKVLVNLTSSQPTPVPVNPPTSVQAIFGTETAKVSWHSPHLLGGQGKGSWQTWMYEVAIKESTSKSFEVVGKTNGTSFSLGNLVNNTEYIIKAAAFTASGKGPFSTEFIGRTLSVNKNGKQPIIFWSSINGLLKSEASGENFETIVHKSSMNNFYFNDITWYQDNLYLVTNTSQVYWYNMVTHENGVLSDIDSVESIAIDWIGKKLYWSNPKQQLIIRGNLNGTQQEPLPILTLAKELNLDSIRGYLYWSTGHAVECAHLNGGDRITYHDSQFFSGKQVMGLTLDMDHHYVYWIVRDSDRSNLFKAPMVGFNKIEQKPPVPEKIASLQKPYMHGPLCYFSNRLIWLQDDKSAIISNLNGQNSATISSKSLMGVDGYLNKIFVMDYSQNILPNYTKKHSSDDISVIPEVIEKQSIRTDGNWENFNITWNPVKNVNFGTVFYELKMDNLSKNNSSVTTTYPSIKYWKKIPPYTILQVYLRAYTYWGASSYIKYKIYSPPSTPTAPQNPRAYVFQQYLQNFSTTINISFRWENPEQPNGILEGYKVTWWYFKGNQSVNNSDIIDSTKNNYVIKTDLKNTTYYFEVQAYTEVGDGEISKTVTVNTGENVPVPTLLVGSSDSIYIYDLDTKKNETVLQGINSPLSIAYLFQERKIFWVNDMQELLVLNLGNLNRNKLLEIKANVIGVSIDWIERSLYYVQLDDTKACTIFKLDLNLAETGTMKSTQVLRTPFKITKMEVSPYARKIYWNEHDMDCRCNRLMQANIDGTGITPLFSAEFRNQLGLHNCNCPVHPTIENIFTVDHSDPIQRPTIVFINSLNKSLIKSDKNGCKCNAQNINLEQSYPLKSLQSDFISNYFINESSNSVYYYRENHPTKKSAIKANNILIYGPHMQPYPPLKCLQPNYNQNLTVLLKNKTAHSLTLKMPQINISKDCENTSFATMEYRIYYMPYISETDYKCDETCTHEVTSEEHFLIKNLRPFSKYLFSLGITNYYSGIKNGKTAIGNGVVFRTAPGAPSQPRNVKVTVLTPTLIKVNWLSPEKLNGYHIYYEIHCQTEGITTGIRKKGEQMVMETDIHNTTNFNKNLDDLSSNETYSIWVRAYSESNTTSTDSEIVKVTTFPEPNNITLLSSTSSKLILQWNSSKNVNVFSVEYTSLISNDWQELKYIKYANNEANITVEKLKPKTQYKFRLLLKYPNYNNDYIWPKDSRFTFETLGDKPSPPGIPVIQHISNDEYQVRWEPSRENGAPVEIYMLETLKFPIYRAKRSTNHSNWIQSGPSIDEPEWESVYNGTDNFWKIADLSEKYRYTFRVSSLNSYGWSNQSEESVQFDPSLAALRLAKKQDLTLFIVEITVPTAVVIALLIFYKCYKTFHDENKKHFITAHRGPDVELATLRELPRRTNFIHNTNVLYTSSFPNTEEITLLPNIRRDQITLKKFLGSGAFGEVFEGLARGLNDTEGEIKVAVKTLRKGATEQEKSEFLQEAQLMSHFKHKHILQLLGVCLDNDPHFIIMELMQGGDLLTFLRSSRKADGNTGTLNLLDLIKMCVDVSKGCRYLEEMHFVHRDLACRNCLVSSIDPENRIVKIGDFGLARDIYKNDYYRKEGEGLLPVRWMAPESLVDGVFTCQSDVWAFGVLLWEIMTLGQQPYPARNNMEVMHYVRSGGRLGKPIDCPKLLYTLMLSCWTYEPERRPTFGYCLNELEKLHIELINSPIKSVHLGQYISTVPQAFADMDGISNRAYFRDENQNSSGASWKSEEEGVRERTPFLPQIEQKPNEIPKYLEIIYDSESPIQNDGYEIPRTAFSKSRLEITPDSSTINSVSSQSSNQVVNIGAQYLLKDNNVGYTNMNNSDLIDKLEKCSL